MGLVRNNAATAGSSSTLFVQIQAPGTAAG